MIRRPAVTVGVTMKSLRLIQAIGTASLLVACTPAPQASPDGAAMAAGYSVKALAGGRLASLPTGSLFIRIINFDQPVGHSFPSKTHVPGFDYVASGYQRLTIQDRPPIDIGPGESVFQPSIAHTHTNPGDGPNNWYFLALWPASARAEPLVDPNVAKVVFQTQDLPADVVPQGSYVQTLRVAELEPGGRNLAHRYGGVDVQYVLEGSISVHMADHHAVTLRAGQGSYHLPGVGLQEHNVGGVRTRFLELLTTGDGRPFETSLDHTL